MRDVCRAWRNTIDGHGASGSRRLALVIARCGSLAETRMLALQWLYNRNRSISCILPPNVKISVDEALDKRRSVGCVTCIYAEGNSRRYCASSAIFRQQFDLDRYHGSHFQDGSALGLGLKLK